MVKVVRSPVVAWAVIVGATLLFSAPVAKAICPQVGFTIVEPHASAATRPVRIGKNQTIYVRREPITTTSDITKIELEQELADPNDADLLIAFTPAADKRLHDATTNHSGRWIAFMFNDEVLVNSEWEGPYGFDPGEKRVSMNHGMKRARKLMKAIRGCKRETAAAKPAAPVSRAAH
jgi:hypothetical protein